MTEESPSRIPAPRQTLAMRLAERERQRRLRAERLARLRAAPPGLAEDPALDPAGEPAAAPGLAPAAAADEAADREDAAAALEEFLRALTGGAKAPPRPDPALAPEADPEPAAVLHFQRPPASPAARRARARPRPAARRRPGPGLGARARRPRPARRHRAARPRGARREARADRPPGPGPGLDRRRPRRPAGLRLDDPPLL